MKNEILAKIAKCFVALTLTGVFSLELSAHPNEWNQVEQIPVGSMLNVEAGLNILPNKSETHAIDWRQTQKNSDTRCRFLHTSESYDRAIPGSSTLSLENMNVTVQDHSSQFYGDALNREVLVNVKAKIFTADVRGNLRSPLKLYCEGTGYYQKEGDSKFYFMPSLTIGAVKAALKSRGIDLLLSSPRMF